MLLKDKHGVHVCSQQPSHHQEQTILCTLGFLSSTGKTNKLMVVPSLRTLGASWPRPLARKQQSREVGQHQKGEGGYGFTKLCKLSVDYSALYQQEREPIKPQLCSMHGNENAWQAWYHCLRYSGWMSHTPW